MADQPDSGKAQVLDVATTPVFAQYLNTLANVRRVVIQNPASNSDVIQFCTKLVGGSVISISPGFFFTLLQGSTDSYGIGEKIGYLRSPSSQVAQVMVSR